MSSQQPPPAADRRLRWLLLVALLLLLVLLWSLWSWTAGGSRADSAPPPAGPATGDGNHTVITPDGYRFTLTAAETQPLLPGRPGTVRVVATNPEPVSLRLTGITVAVQQPASADCRPQWLQITPWTGDRPLPAGGTVTVDLAAELLDLPGIDQSGCRGGSFPLRLSGTGRSAA